MAMRMLRYTDTVGVIDELVKRSPAGGRGPPLTRATLDLIVESLARDAPADPVRHALALLASGGPTGSRKANFRPKSANPAGRRGRLQALRAADRLLTGTECRPQSARPASSSEFVDLPVEFAAMAVEELNDSLADGVMAEAREKWRELDTDHSFSLEVDELEKLAAWVFGKFSRSFKSESARQAAVAQQVAIQWQPPLAAWCSMTVGQLRDSFGFADISAASGGGGGA